MACKKIMGVNVNYEFIDMNYSTTIVLLHGWGQNILMMKPIGDRFKNKYNILNIDLPGFGNSEEPSFSWNIYDYVTCLRKLILYLKLDKIIIIGHSFGGRIALVYTSKYPVIKLVCFASPYCSEIKKLPLLSRIYKKIKYIKCLNWLARIIKKHVGSKDYRNASDIMRGVLVKVVNQDITEDIKKINIPTLLVWGSLDKAVPLDRAYEIKNMISDSAVIVYEGASHYAYLERLNQVVKVLDSFFN